MHDGDALDGPAFAERVGDLLDLGDRHFGVRFVLESSDAAAVVVVTRRPDEGDDRAEDAGETTAAALDLQQTSATLNLSFGAQVDINFTSNNQGIAAPAPGKPWAAPPSP